MPRIVEIDGKQFEVPDNATYDQIADFVKAQPTVAGDVAKSIPSGFARGVAGLVGLPETAARGMRWTAEQAGRLVGSPVDQDYIEGKNQVKGPTAEGTQKAIESVTGELYEPKTRAGRYAGNVAEFVPGALGPGGAVRNLTRFAVAPGVASEAAGEATKGTKYEPYARAAAGLLGVGAASIARSPQAGERAVSRALRNVSEAELADAGRLMMEARVRGIDLTWAEAVQQVTGSRTGMGNLQRVAEGSQRGQEVLGPMMAARPGQVEQAFNREMGNIAAVPMAASTIGPRASEAAEAVFENSRRGINRQTEPLYRASEADNVPASTLRRLNRHVPGFTEALAAVRGNPHLNHPIANLPDTSVAVLNEVKKQLDEQARNVAQVTNPQRNMQVASSNERSAAAVRRAGRRASRPYRDALDQQEAHRGGPLRDLREGPIGRVATATDTASAGRALLPDSPLPNSAAETGRATRQLVGENANVTRNLVRSRLESMYQTAGRDLQGGASQFAGAAARKKIYGDRQLRRNVRAVLREMPNGAQVSEGFERLMEVFQATGRRQHIGSQTEFNRLLTTELSGGRVLGEALTGAAGRFNPFSAVRDRYQQWRLGANLGELAHLLTNPNAQQRLVELSRMRHGEPRMHLLAAQLGADMIEGAGVE